MTDRIIYLFHNPRLTGHEIKWGAGGGFDEGWIYFQQSIKDNLEKSFAGKRRSEILSLLDEKEMRYQEYGDGTLIVWLDKHESQERGELKTLEANIAEAIRRQIKKLPRQTGLLTVPSEVVLRQMAKAALAVYLATVDHPIIYESDTDP